MTRVTEKLMFGSMSQAVSRAQERVMQTQRIAQTGVRVERSSQDPVAATRAEALDSGIRKLESMTSASTRATLELTAAESALGTVDLLLNRTRELAIMGANATLSAEERADIAVEIGYIRESVLAAANTKIAGNYIFGGYKTNAEPFLSDGSYVGDAGVREGEVAPGVTAKMNLSGEQAFTVAGGQDIFALLDNLQSSLVANDQAAVGNSLGGIEASQRQVRLVRGEAGLAMSRVVDADTTRDKLRFEMREARSDLVEADIVESYVDLMAAQSALQAAMAEASRILSGLASGPRL